MLRAALVVLLAATPAATPVRDARVYAQHRAGTVSFAVIDTQGRFNGYRPDVQYRTASVVKAMILVVYMRRRLPLDPDARSRLYAMITRSDNLAANWAYGRIGGAPAVQALAAPAGMRSFAANSYWAYSLTSARDQVVFFARIERLLPAARRAWAMSLLRRIIPYQRWGIPRAAPGWRIAFKGGWLESTNLVHQVGLLERGDRRLVIAVFTDNNPSHAYGAATIEGVTRRLLR